MKEHYKLLVQRHQFQIYQCIVWESSLSNFPEIFLEANLPLSSWIGISYRSHWCCSIDDADYCGGGYSVGVDDHGGGGGECAGDVEEGKGNVIWALSGRCSSVVGVLSSPITVQYPGIELMLSTLAFWKASLKIQLQGALLLVFL